MADTTQEKARVHTPVDPLIADKPFYLVIYQTETRNVITVHHGADALATAKAEAAERAEATGRKVYVAGPQIAAYAPPEKPKVQEIPFFFDESEEQ